MTPIGGLHFVPGVGGASHACSFEESEFPYEPRSGTQRSQAFRRPCSSFAFAAVGSLRRRSADAPCRHGLAGEGADCCDTHMRPLAKRYAFIAI